MARRPAKTAAGQFAVEIQREADGRWIADVPALPGCMVYGATREEARVQVVALALHVLAERIENGDAPPDFIAGAFDIAAA